MQRNVAIVGYSQTKHAEVNPNPRERMIFTLARGMLDELGAARDDIDTFVLCSNDFQDGRTISEVYTIPWIGAFFKDQTKVDLDGSNAVFYALMRILSGNYDTAMIIGYAMGGSEFRSQLVMNHVLDPIFDREAGLLNEISAGALQARAYMDKYGMTEKQLAVLAAKNLRNAAKNPFALRTISDADADTVLSSRELYSPIRELHTYPPTDGACVLLLAAEEKVSKFTDKPVWIRGIANCQDGYYFGDRDLLKADSLRDAAQKAYSMAGIKNPAKEIDVAELQTIFTSQEPIFAEALGLFKEGSGASMADEGLTEISGRIPINPSGGPAGAMPLTAGGLISFAEIAAQLQGNADNRQVDNAATGLAHGQTGICAQHNLVAVLSNRKQGGKKR